MASAKVAGAAYRVVLSTERRALVGGSGIRGADVI
jgi:hypothetical protein